MPGPDRSAVFGLGLSAIEIVTSTPFPVTIANRPEVVKGTRLWQDAQ